MGLLTHPQKTDSHIDDLIEDLHQTQHDLANAYSNLEYMTDPDLIDYYIYQVKAVQMRHKFLLAKVKQLNL